jgi:hypothetical protein
VSPVKYELGSYIPEDDILHRHRRENLKFCMDWVISDPNDVKLWLCRSSGRKSLASQSGDRGSSPGEVLWEIPCSWIWRRVRLLRTDVPEESVSSIFRVEKITEVGTASAVNSLAELMLFLACRFFPP